MRPEEPNHQNARLILDARYQSIVVVLDTENDASRLQYACPWKRCLDVLWNAPIGAADEAEPRIILRTRRLDPAMPGAVGEIGLHRVRADDDHGVRIAKNSKNWKF